MEFGDVFFEVADRDVDREAGVLVEGSEGDVADEGGLAGAGVALDDKAAVLRENLLFEVFVFVILEVNVEFAGGVAVGGVGFEAGDFDGFGA